MNRTSSLPAPLCRSIGLVAALVWELTRKDPIVDFRLLKNRNFFLATLTMFMLGFVMYGSTALLPIFLQTLLGYTAMLSGLVLSPGGIMVIIMLPLVGKLLTHFDARWLVIFGVVIVAASLFHMATFNLDIDFRTAMMARIYQSAGMAFLFVPINVMAFYFIPKEKFNNATGIINLARNIGGSFGIANVVTLLARRTQFHQGMLVSHMTPFDSAYQGDGEWRGEDPVRGRVQLSLMPRPRRMAWPMDFCSGTPRCWLSWMISG